MVRVRVAAFALLSLAYPLVVYLSLGRFEPRWLSLLLFTLAALRALTRQLTPLTVKDAVVELPAHVPFTARSVHWVKPVLVAEVAFRGWAKEGLLRQASFKRLREDKHDKDLGATATAVSPT
ncbi:hypothetical protein OEZ79_25680, partial [Leclercia adecarboxylata]|nr:hypothetical protein [Leclercia adecarboxylata]